MLLEILAADDSEEQVRVLIFQVACPHNCLLREVVYCAVQIDQNIN